MNLQRPRMRNMCAALIVILTVFMTACGSTTAAPAGQTFQKTGSMQLSYAEQFSVDYYNESFALITIADGSRYLLVPEGETVPEDAPQDVTVLRQPLSSVYAASSSAVDLFLHADALDAVKMTGTKAVDWTIPEIRRAVEADDILYVGKYSAPDYEAVIEEGCTLAIENTMILHAPETKEKLESLGIPVIIEYSSYETHPLGRVEWIKLYGLLTGHLAEAEAFFENSEQAVRELAAYDAAGKTAVFFYITSSGYANVRKPGDYIAKMIGLAGGTYLFPSDVSVDENALSTVNMQLETFYAGAQDADILFYNTTVGGEPESLAAFTEQYPLFSGFRAVQEGNVYCTGQNMFQQVSGTADMITDFHTVFSGGDMQTLTYLYKLE